MLLSLRLNTPVRRVCLPVYATIFRQFFTVCLFTIVLFTATQKLYNWYLTTVNDTYGYFMPMCRKAVNQSINWSINQSIWWCWLNKFFITLTYQRLLNCSYQIQVTLTSAHLDLDLHMTTILRTTLHFVFIHTTEWTFHLPAWYR